MTHSNLGPTRKAVRYALIAVLAAVIGGTVTAGKNDDLQRKIAAGSFSKITHSTGLKRAQERFADVMRKGEYKQSEQAREKLFSKDPDSKESTAFINKMVKQFGADHGMRRSTFTVTHKRVDPAGNLHIIMAQRIDNVKVKAGKVTLHFNKEGELYDLSGRIQEDADIETTPQIGADEAIALGKKTIDSRSEVDGSPELSIVAGRLTYIVLLSEGDIPGAWKVTVDARSGEVLEKNSTLRFLAPPGFPDNGYYTPMTGNICQHEGGGIVTVNGWHDNTDGQNYLYNDNEHWHIVNNLTPQIYSNSSPDWGESNRPAMNLAYNFGRIMEFLSDSMSMNSFDNQGKMAFALYPIEGVNAFWIPNKQYIQFGEGDGGVTGYEWVVLDGVAHECGHAVSQFSPSEGFDRSEEAKALDEGYSDILGACVEEAFQPDGRDHYPFGRRSTEATFDWLICEDIFVDGGERWWLRNMREPWVGGHSGAHASLYHGSAWSWGENYYPNSTVLSHAFYLLTEGVGVESVNDATWQHRYGPFRGIGIGAARKIAWESQFNGRVPGDADYYTVRNAWIATAQELWYDAGLVAQVFAAVGVIDRTVGRPAGTNLPTNPPNHTTISEAIASAQVGDLIYVYPGTYVENLTINWPDISIISRNRDLTTIDGTVTIGAYADRTTISGFTIDANPFTTAVSINGSSSDQMQGVTISNNAIRNCNKAVSVSYGFFNSILNNRFQSGTGGSIALDNSSFTNMQDNTINGGGIFFGPSNGYNWVTYNRWNNVTTDGVRFTTNSSWNTIFSMNEFVSIGGIDITGSIPLFGLNYYHNVFNTQSGLAIYLPNTTNGSFYGNTFSPNSHSINTPTSYSFNSNYWSDYNGEDTDGDGLGNTNLPHAERDNSPLMNPIAQAINFNHNGSLLMASTVRNGKLRVAGTAGTGTASGLKFGANSSLTTSGNLVGSQILINSGRWLDEKANLTGGLVFCDAEGTPQMHVSTDGIVRTRNNLTPGF